MSDLKTLYLAFEAIRADAEVAPVVGDLIATLGAQLHPPGREEVGEFAVGSIVYHADVSDRFGRACVYGSRQERDDLELFLGLCDHGSVVWDIGANFGLYAVAAAERVGATGAIFAAEPSPRARALLQDNVARNAAAAPIQVFPCAISDFNGTATFHDAQETAFSGLSDTHRSAIASTIEVEVRRLDDLWEANGRRPIDLIKIDVEGHEAGVLAGAAEAIGASPELVVQFEVSPKNLDEARGQQLLAALRKLEADGMALWHLDKAGRALTRTSLQDGLPPDATGNVFMVRQGTDRESRLRAIAARWGARPPVVTTELERALVRTINLINARQKSRNIEQHTMLNDLRHALGESEQALKEVLRRRQPPPLGTPFRPFSLARIYGITAVVRVTADAQDLRAAAAMATTFGSDLLRSVVFVDARPTAGTALDVPREASLAAPPLAASHRYSAGVLAGLRAVETSHILLFDADAILEGSLEAVIARWAARAAHGERVAGMAFAFADGSDPPLRETTLGGLLALRHGVLAAAPLRRLAIRSDLYDGDGFDLDLSLRLWHAGFTLTDMSSAVTARSSLPRPTLVTEDAPRLEKEWTGIFAHPHLPHLFAQAGVRPV